MSKKTREEVEKLKKDWLKDSCWDIEDTEGFEEYKEELLQYRLKCEAEWELERIKREKETDEQARKLGVEGLYRIVMQNKELLERQTTAINYLADGESFKAYRALQGYID
jgi:hypothetical protein